MTTKEQDQIIIKYLLDKKLSIEVAAEVYDHMIVQIDNLQHEENLSFDEAWMKTKDSWLADLKMSYDVRYSMDDISEIMKKVTRKKWKREVSQALPLTLLCTVLLTLVFTSLPQEWIFFFQIFVGLFFLSMLGYSTSSMRSYNKLMKQFKNNKITTTPTWSNIAVGSGALLTTLFQENIWQAFYNSFQALMSGEFTTNSIILILSFIFLMSIVSYFPIAFFSFSKRMKKTLVQIQPFLNKIEDKKP
jgi:hypothetical protein